MDGFDSLVGDSMEYLSISSEAASTETEVVKNVLTNFIKLLREVAGA